MGRQGTKASSSRPGTRPNTPSLAPLRAPLLALLACTAACGAEPASRTEANPSTIYAMPLLGEDRGPTDALVTIIEAGDFQCPFCKTQAAVLHQLADDYPADLRLFYAHLPLVELHERALPAALGAACAAAQGKFWDYHDALYAAAPALDDDTLLRHATALDLDLDAWRSCRDEPATRQAVLAQRERLIAFGVRGTPSFFVNGHFVRGGQSLAMLHALVDRALAAARATLAADGLAAADFYQRVVLEGGRPAGS